MPSCRVHYQGISFLSLADVKYLPGTVSSSSNDRSLVGENPENILRFYLFFVTVKYYQRMKSVSEEVLISPIPKRLNFNYPSPRGG